MNALEEAQSSLSNIPDIIERFEAELNNAKAHLQIEGKNLERANREQPTWLAYYDERRIELYALVKFFEQRVEAKKGELYRHYRENYSIELGQREIDSYIRSDGEFEKIYNLFLEVKLLYDKYQSVVDAFIARGYSLKNITDIRIHSLQDVTL